MFLNRWLYRHELIEMNQLTPEEQKEVFAVLKPFFGEGGEERFLESTADVVIERVRSGRPPSSSALCFEAEEKMTTTATIDDLIDRFFDRLAPVIDRFIPPEKTPQQRMLTSEEAAESMKLNTQTVVKWCREGKLEGSKVGRKWLVHRNSVDAYLRRQQVVYGRSVK